MLYDGHKSTRLELDRKIESYTATAQEGKNWIKSVKLSSGTVREANGLHVHALNSRVNVKMMKVEGVETTDNIFPLLDKIQHEPQVFRRLSEFNSSLFDKVRTIILPHSTHSC